MKSCNTQSYTYFYVPCRRSLNQALFLFVVGCKVGEGLSEAALPLLYTTLVYYTVQLTVPFSSSSSAVETQKLGREKRRSRGESGTESNPFPTHYYPTPLFASQSAAAAASASADDKMSNQCAQKKAFCRPGGGGGERPIKRGPSNGAGRGKQKGGRGASSVLPLR